MIEENAFENVVWKKAAILSLPQCINQTHLNFNLSLLINRTFTTIRTTRFGHGIPSLLRICFRVDLYLSLFGTMIHPLTFACACHGEAASESMFVSCHPRLENWYHPWILPSMHRIDACSLPNYWEKMFPRQHCVKDIIVIHRGLSIHTHISVMAYCWLRQWLNLYFVLFTGVLWNKILGRSMYILPLNVHYTKRDRLSNIAYTGWFASITHVTNHPLFASADTGIYSH